MSRYDAQLARMRRAHPGLHVAETEEQAIVNAWLGAAARGERHRVLDAGCGFQNGLVVRFRGRLWAVGIDADHATVRNNRDLDAKAVADCESIPLRAGSVDLIFCRFVIEHLQDPGTAVREFFRVLKPGGTAVLSTVNARNPAMWVARFTPMWLRRTIRSASFGPELEDNAPTYYRANTEARLRSVLEREGFRVSACYFFPTFVWYFRFATPLLLFFTYVDRWLDALGLTRFNGGMLMAASKPAQPRAT